MKHPVDTSTWGKFKVGELFDFSGCKQVKSQHNLIETDKENGIPFVVQSNANNMVKCYVTRESLLSNDETIYNGNAIMLGVMTPVVSYQEHEFGASQSIALRADFLNPLRGLFIATVIKSVIEPKYNYANIPGIQKYKNEIIPLPLKPGTNHADYSQDDIDWDYMEGFMSRVQEAATKRLANLPEPGQKSKTPVDVSGWGEFDVIALFDIINTKSIRQSDVQAQLQSNNGSTPYITASDKNNAILAFIECPQEWIDEGNCIFIGGKTTTITYQQKDFCSNDSHNLALYLKHKQARTEHIQLYLVSIFKKTFAKYHWGDALSKTKIKTESIKLPLKPSADPSNYTQDDIDWYYMEQFMEQFQTLAKNRLEELTATYDYDILTV